MYKQFFALENLIAAHDLIVYLKREPYYRIDFSRDILMSFR
jgi:hypothetical protein